MSAFDSTSRSSVAAAPASFSADELRRYARQTILPELGREGQARLKAGSVLLVGAGGLGSPAALYLAAAGVGRLGLIDGDQVDLSNLHRQVLYGTLDVGDAKTSAAARRLRDLNPFVAIEQHPTRLVAANALDIISRYDLVLDGADNFPTRYLVNDACVLAGRPLVHGSVYRFEGQVTDLHWRGGPCYRCLYPQPPPAGTVPSCAEGGVLGVLPGLVGMIQATEAIKILAGLAEAAAGESLAGRLLLLDALTMRFREFQIARNPDCPVCGDHPTITTLTDLDDACAAPPGARPETGAGASTLQSEVSKLESPAAALPPVPAGGPGSMTVEQLQEILDSRPTDGARPLLLDVREPDEFASGHLPGACNVPIGALESQLAALDPESSTVVYCQMGGRSAWGAQLLAQRGFRRVWNLEGGVSVWPGALDQSDS